MPQFEVTISTRRSKSTLTKTVKVQAVGETHAKQILFASAKGLKKIIKIIFIKEV